MVEQVRGPDIMASGGEKLVARNVQKEKKVKERPEYLQERRKEAGTQDDSDKEEKARQ